MKEAPKIVFLGTPDFAVDSLAILLEHGYDIRAVVTAPDQPSGRGLLLHSPPVKDFAVSHGLRVLQPEKLRDPVFTEELRGLEADLFIVVAFRMLPAIIWQMPPRGTFNLHASLLPQYRGAAPINHAIMNGETETGLTTFFLRQEIDTGEIIFREKMPISPEETAGELHNRMKTAGAELVLKTTEAIFAGNVSPSRQMDLIDPRIPLKTAPKIFREDCRIDWSDSIDSIYNKIRGLSPYPAAFTHFISPEGEIHPVKIFRASKSASEGNFKPSMIITDGRTSLSVAAADGLLHIQEIQQAGKKKMNTEEFLRGFRIISDWRVG